MTVFEYLQDFLGRLRNTTEEASVGSSVAECVLVSTQTPMEGRAYGVVGYSVGMMMATGGHPIPNDRGEAALTQFFSDRSTAVGEPSVTNPFSGTTDDALLTLAVDAPTATAAMSLTLQSWGANVMNFENLRLYNGLLLADGPSIGNAAPAALYSLALSSPHLLI